MIVIKDLYKIVIIDDIGEIHILVKNQNIFVYFVVKNLDKNKI